MTETMHIASLIPAPGGRKNLCGAQQTLSNAYDIDLLPEQLFHLLRVNPDAAEPNSRRMAAVCELWSNQK